MNGVKVELSSKLCGIIFKGKCIASASVITHLYKLNQPIYGVKAEVICSASFDLWHRRMGHRDPVAVQKLTANHLATGIEIKNSTL